MCIRKRTLMVWGTAVASVAFLVGVLGMPNTARPAAAQVDPADLFQQYIDAVNDGDVDGVMEVFTDDAIWQSEPLCVIRPCVGKDAIRNVTEFMVAANSHLTITSAEVSGDTVTGALEGDAEWNRAVGVERMVCSYRVEVRDGKISDYRCEWDFTDRQLQEFLTRVFANRIELQMGPGRDEDQSPGYAVLSGFGDWTSIEFTITPGPAGVPQPIHIHEGRCADLGAVAFPLHDVGGGVSGTVVDVPVSELQTGNFAINVQKSEDEPDVFVACGDIPAAAPEAPPVEPAPAPEVVIAPAPPTAPTTGSGGLLAEEGSGVATWWYALAGGGALLVMGGLAGLRKARG